MRRVGLLGLLGFVLALGVDLPSVEAGRAEIGWAELHRALHLPQLPPGSACPVSRVDPRVDWDTINIFGRSGIGPGPVYPGLGGSGGRADANPDQQYGSTWADAKVFWYVAPSYRDRVLIRARRVMAPGLLGFNGDTKPKDELRIEPYDTVHWDGQPAGSRGIATSVRVLASGCYAAQIDGATFSRIVVFRVVVHR
jgi:hypothetical protein